MVQANQLARRALVSGFFAGLATAVAAAFFGALEKRRPLAPINATSHVIWGEEAAHAPQPELRYTLPGLALNFGAGVFWAAIYERLFGRAAEKSGSKAVLGGAAVATAAYLVDYHLVPSRLTPGWERQISPRALALVFGALALSLPVRSLAQRRR